MSLRLPSEFGINMNLHKAMIVQQSDLDRISNWGYFDDENPCHIYFICKRPLISIDNTDFSVTDDRVNLTFKIQYKENYKRMPLSFINDYGFNNITLSTEYPFTEFQLRHEDRILVWHRAATFLQKASRFLSQNDFLDLEILYIGQSYGEDGTRTAPDRLKSHSTLQLIYSEAITKNRDSEIWLVLTSFEQINLMMYDGRLNLTTQEKIEDASRFETVYNKVVFDGINEQQKINFTEAALIRYFEPPYNKIYKDSFPNPAHVTYSECYDLDINSVAIELNTLNMLDCMFYTAKIPRMPWNSKHFLLKSKEERKSMFEIF